jgi:hypothetical protein
MITSGSIEIQVVDTEQVIRRMDLPGVEGYMLGRTDASSTYTPDVDLADYGARDFGVSRRHAVLVRYRGMLHLVDLSSVNGTFLNGERLLPDVPYPVNNGDQMSVANLNLRITHLVTPGS